MTMAETGELIKELESLLLKQLKCAEAEDLEALLPMASQADRLVELISSVADVQDLHHDPRADGARELYRRLCLVLASRKSTLSDRLRKLRGSKKAVRAYGRNT